MGFKQFLERDEKDIAQKWIKEIPPKTNRINRDECYRFAGLMADRETNKAMIEAALQSQQKEVKTYNKLLVGGLLRIYADEITTRFPLAAKLRKGNGFVRSIGNPMFSFIPHDGSLVIISPPHNYNPIDVLALFSIVYHESRHAYDFAIGVLKPEDTVPNMSFDEFMNQRAEARAYGDQIIILIEEMMSMFQIDYQTAIQHVETVISQGAFGFDEKVLWFAKIYLKVLKENPKLVTQRKTEATLEELVSMQKPTAQQTQQIQVKVLEIMKLLAKWAWFYDASNFFKAYSKQKGIDFYALGKEEFHKMTAEQQEKERQEREPWTKKRD